MDAVLIPRDDVLNPLPVGGASCHDLRPSGRGDWLRVDNTVLDGGVALPDSADMAMCSPVASAGSDRALGLEQMIRVVRPNMLTRRLVAARRVREDARFTDLHGFVFRTRQIEPARR